METIPEARGHPAVHGHSDPRIVLAADAVSVDPDDVLSVGPFEELDIGAGDAVHPDVEQLSERSVRPALDHQVELVIDTEAAGKLDRSPKKIHIFPALTLRHSGSDKGPGEVLAHAPAEAPGVDLICTCGGRRSRQCQLGMARR